ncbi:MAG: AsmA-like C-terminal region-containing protein [SAR86 cluster bacterium]
MKKFLKYLLICILIPVLSFSFVSSLFSNEKTIVWVLEILSEELGYQSKVKVSNIVWSPTRSSISLKEVSVREKEKGNSVYSESLEIKIDLLNLVRLKEFLELKIDKATVQFEDFNLNTDYSHNKLNEFFLNKSYVEVRELNIKGSIKEVDIPKYFYLFTNNSGKSNTLKISIEDVFISKIKLGPLELLDTTLNLKPFSESFDLVVSNSELEGKIVVKQPIKEGIRVNLSSLKLSLDNFKTSNIFIYLLDNLAIPVGFSIDKLLLDEKDYGRLSFLVTKEKEKLFFNQIEFRGINLDLGKNVEDEVTERNFFLISRKEESIHSAFKGNIFTDNLSQSLLGLKGADYDLNFLAGASNINLDISWEGLPNQFNINNVEGNLSFRIDDFATKDVDSDILGSSDFLRLVSLFNVSNTFGDLTNLNFKKKFNSGFQADRVEGALVIEKDLIKTLSPIVFNSGSGEFRWDGSIEKTNKGELENLDFDIVITLPLREYLPAYALILGGPLTAATVYIAGKAFKKPLNKLSSGRWKVSGSVEDPKTEFLEWFE